MELRVNQTTPAAPTEAAAPVEKSDGNFKFTLTSQIEEKELQQKLNSWGALRSGPELRPAVAKR